MWPKELEESGSSSVWLLFGCAILGKSHNLSSYKVGMLSGFKVMHGKFWAQGLQNTKYLLNGNSITTATNKNNNKQCFLTQG